jgi:hypothetical protein
MGLFDDELRRKRMDEANRVAFALALQEELSKRAVQVCDDLVSHISRSLQRADIQVERQDNKVRARIANYNLEIACIDSNSFTVTGDNGSADKLSQSEMAQRVLAWLDTLSALA